MDCAQQVLLYFGLLTGILSVGTLLFAIRIGSLEEELFNNTQIPTKDEMKKYILWHSFYVNPKDPRGWVPKTRGFGWTVNFRNRRNAQIFAALVLATLGSALCMIPFAYLCL